jgi:hypothetical protein
VRLYGDVTDASGDEYKSITAADGTKLKDNSVSNQVADDTAYPMRRWFNTGVQGTISFSDDSLSVHTGTVTVTAPAGYRVLNVYTFMVRRDAKWKMSDLNLGTGYWRGKSVGYDNAGSTISSYFQAYDWNLNAFGDSLIPCWVTRCTSRNADYNYFMFADVCTN